MTIEVRVPQLPESVADATLVSWHKKPGDIVARDENLVDLETDKVVLEVPAPAAGTLMEIKLGDGTTVTSGQILALIEASAGASTGIPGASAAPVIVAADGSQATPSAHAGGKLSPAAKRVAEEKSVDPKAVLGSGRDGRVSKSDVMNYLSTKGRAGHGTTARRQTGRACSTRDSGGPRGPRGAACADDAVASANRRALDTGAVDSSFAHLVQ